MRHNLSEQSVENLEKFIQKNADDFPNLVYEGEVLLSQENLSQWSADILETAAAEGWDDEERDFEVSRANPGKSPLYLRVKVADGLVEIL